MVTGVIRLGTDRSPGGWPTPAPLPSVLPIFPALRQIRHLGVGHSSTSISAALGMALAAGLKGEDRKTIAVVVMAR